VVQAAWDWLADLDNRFLGRSSRLIKMPRFRVFLHQFVLGIRVGVKTSVGDSRECDGTGFSCRVTEYANTWMTEIPLMWSCIPAELARNSMTS